MMNGMQATGRVMDRAGTAVERAGLRMVKRLRGAHVCCEDERNIKRQALPVDGSFDFNNPTHRANAARQLVAARCRVCGTKYWSSAGGGDTRLIIRPD